MSSSEYALDTLNSVTTDTLTLVGKLETVVSTLASDTQLGHAGAGQPVPEQLVAGEASLDALALAHDSAVLIKAHATKISLLIINEPFTATAITKVLRELVAGPVPSLAAAVQVCAPERYTGLVRRDLSWRAGRLLRELKELVSRIPRDGSVLSDAKKSAPAGAVGGRGSIATTGVLWSACDDVVAFSKRGFGGNLVHKVDQLRDTLKDVMEELKEWGEETGDEDDSEDDLDGRGVAQLTSDLESASISVTRDAQAVLDDLMNSQRHIPRDDPEKIRDRLESCLRRLRLTTLLYQATIKRRLKPLPQVPPHSESDIPARLDEVMSLLKGIPEKFGSLALAFYELEVPEIDRLMDECFFDAFAVSELLVKPWDGQKDEFTDWALRFQSEIKKG